MRKPTKEDIRYAHDVMHNVLDEEKGFQLDDEEMGTVMGICAALGWILGEPCGRELGKALEACKAMLKDAGYEMVDTRKEMAQ